MARKPKEDVHLIAEYRFVSRSMRKHLNKEVIIDMNAAMKRMLEIEDILMAKGYTTGRPHVRHASDYGPGYFTFKKTP